MEVFGANGVDGMSGGCSYKSSTGEWSVRLGLESIGVSLLKLYTSGLRQGCVLSPLLFSLYINGAVEKLGAA